MEDALQEGVPHATSHWIFHINTPLTPDKHDYFCTKLLDMIGNPTATTPPPPRPRSIL